MGGGSGGGIGAPTPAPSISTPPSGVKSATVRFNPAPPPPAPHVTPPPYDAALDGAWQNYLEPNDHAFRNVLNEMDPDQRQLILQQLMRQRALMPLGAAQSIPPTF